MLMSKSRTQVSLCLKNFKKIHNLLNNPEEKSSRVFICSDVETNVFKGKMESH